MIEHILRQHCQSVYVSPNGEITATCPFHSDKTPSFSYNTLNECYYCFSCHVKGKGVRKLLKQLGYRGRDFLDASLGLLQEPHPIVEESKKINPKDVAYARFMYESSFSWMTADCPEAWYLFSRYLLPQTLEHFHVRVLSHTVSHTIFFPLFYNECVYGYQRRQAHDLDKRRKYLTMRGLDKSNYLYGEQKAGVILLLCEGVTDVLKAWQYGVKNVVATLGSQVSEAQWQMLSRQVKGVICAFHDDKAGNEGYSLLQIRAQQDQVPCERLYLVSKDIAESTTEEFRIAWRCAVSSLFSKTQSV